MSSTHWEWEGGVHDNSNDDNDYDWDSDDDDADNYDDGNNNDYDDDGDADAADALLWNAVDPRKPLDLISERGLYIYIPAMKTTVIRICFAHLFPSLPDHDHGEGDQSLFTLDLISERSLYIYIPAMKTTIIRICFAQYINNIIIADPHFHNNPKYDQHVILNQPIFVPCLF